MLIERATPRSAGEIARVHVASWRETYRNILPTGFLDAMSVSMRADYWGREISNPAAQLIVYLARRASGEVVGFCAAGPERDRLDGYDGELHALYLLADHQGSGVGKQLYLSAAECLDEQGYNSMALWVLADNPARGFYEHMGGLQVSVQMIELAGTQYREVAYGWPALREMLDRNRSQAGP